MSGGNIFVANWGNGTIGEYTTTGATVNAALVSGLNNPWGLAVSGGNIFVANWGNGTIGEYTTTGATVNALLVSGLNKPTGIAVSGGYIFVANNGAGAIGEYTTAGATVNASLVSELNNPLLIEVEPVAAQVPFTNSLVAYFPFNGNANDASGNGNNGTLLGAAAFGVDRFGNSNSCLSLPGTQGTGSGVDVPSLSSMSYSPVTYSAWFLLNNYPPPNNSPVMTLMGREQCGSQSQGAICTYTSDGFNNDLIYYTGATGITTQLVPPTNLWCQVVVTIDQTGRGNLYFNGTNVPATGSAPNGQPLDFRIGASSGVQCNPYTPRYVWNGLIDDVRIYNLALSASQVQQLYAYESAPKPVSICKNSITTMSAAFSTSNSWTYINVNVVKQVRPANLEKFEVFDIFRGQNIPAGQKSLAYAFTYRNPERTLTDAEVNSSHEKLVEQFKQTLQATVREA